MENNHSDLSAAIAGDRSVASVYTSEIKTKHKTDHVDITVEAGRIKDFKVSPPVDDEPDRVPITEAEKRGVTDPMTGSMLHVPNGELLSASTCKRTLPLFDGRFRYNLKLAFKRMDTVKAGKLMVSKLLDNTGAGVGRSERVPADLIVRESCGG